MHPFPARLPRRPKSRFCFAGVSRDLSRGSRDVRARFAHAWLLCPGAALFLCSDASAHASNRAINHIQNDKEEELVVQCVCMGCQD